MVTKENKFQFFVLAFGISWPRRCVGLADLAEKTTSTWNSCPNLASTSLHETRHGVQVSLADFSFVSLNDQSARAAVDLSRWVLHDRLRRGLQTKMGWRMETC